MRIIPAIDIIDGKCVRLSKGRFDTQKVYSSDPVEVARQFEDSGIKHLHLVDLDGARSESIVHCKVLENIAQATNLIIDFGGGVRSKNDIDDALNAGARQVTIGSTAAQRPDLFREWLHLYGSDILILGADCIEGKIYTKGWTAASVLDIIPFIKDFRSDGLKYVVCTDIERDGMLEGPATELYEEIVRDTDVALVASGGIRSIDDLRVLRAVGCDGAIIGKAIYEGRMTLREIELFSMT